MGVTLRVFCLTLDDHVSHSSQLYPNIKLISGDQTQDFLEYRVHYFYL